MAKMTKKGLTAAAVLIAGAAITLSPAIAQDDWKAAKAAGDIGEKPDGYLGVISSGGGLTALVNDINIKRKAAYTRKAQETGSTVEQFAFTSGCNLILRTTPGEKYMAPDGSRWLTRDASPPVRDSRCP